MRKVVPDDRARQGPSGRPVLGVLIGALLLLGIALAGYLIWMGVSIPDAPETTATTGSATTGSTTVPDSTNPTGNVPPANPAYPAPEAERSATPNQ